MKRCLILFFLFFFPFFAFAAEESLCGCFCAVDGVGATPLSKGGDAKMTSSDCSSLCKEEGYSVAVCAFTSDQLPSQNVNCFTAEQCTGQNGVLGTQQPGECMNGFFYCYPDPNKIIKTDLQVEIGGLSVTGDIGEYFLAIYNWMIGSATAIAIVFIMVGGLRWTFGALSTEQMKKAQHQMMNGVIGLVLLLSSYLLLFTINPHLVNLQVPKFPMIREVALVKDKSCNYLSGHYGGFSDAERPYLIINGAPDDSPFAKGQPPPKGGHSYEFDTKTVTNGADGLQGTCGSVAELVKDWEGKDLPQGSSCTFDYCKDPGTKCFGRGSSAQCMKCTDVYPDNDLGISASDSVCSSLQLPQLGNTRNYCFFSTDADVLSGITEQTLEAALGIGTCAEMKIQCGSVKSCEDYEKQAVLSKNDSDTLQLINPGTGKINLQSICDRNYGGDPCGVAEQQSTKVKRVRCVFEDEINDKCRTDNIPILGAGEDD